MTVSTTPPRDSLLPLVAPLPNDLDPGEAFARLAHLPQVVFFDSAMRHPELGRYSFLAADPFEWLEVPADGSDALSVIANRLQRFPARRAAQLPPFQGGAAGLFAYELAHSLEQIPATRHDEFGLPGLAVGLYDVVAAWDHVADQGWIISQGFPEHEPLARLDRAAARLAWMQHQLADRGQRPEPRHATTDPLPADQLATMHTTHCSSALVSNFSPAGYRAAVQQAVDYIHAGDVFQVNLSQRLLHSAQTDSVELYQRLRTCNPAPQAGYLDIGPFQICSASPERFVALADGQVETRPIKGTRGRAAWPEADLFTGDELRQSEKDRAENVMIVDLLRNDLSRVCVPESVCVSKLCGLETFAYVQHLVSVVVGRLQNSADAFDLLRAVFPGGSITGAPKPRALEIIAELEPTARGAYCGALGYIAFHGEMDSSILIRTITAGKGWWQFPVGGGIVAQSDPQAELEETWQKAAGLLRAVEAS